MRTVLFCALVSFGLFVQAEPRLLEAPSQPGEPARSVDPYFLMSSEEKAILARGEISDVGWILGGIFSISPGFGVGQALQGRYRDTGWIFTLGELGSIVFMVSGICVSRNTSNSGFWSCQSDWRATAGLVGLLGFRIWGIVDAWGGPPEHNNRYRFLKSRLDKRTNAQLMLLPLPQGAVAGFSLSF